MHYNIALLPKKVTNYVTWLVFMESKIAHSTITTIFWKVIMKG